MSESHNPGVGCVREGLAGNLTRVGFCIPRFCLLGFCLLLLLSLSSVAAIGGDLRLIDAVKHSDTAAIRSLIQTGADVNATEVDGATARHRAVSRDDLKAVHLLITAGANVKALNRYSVSPLMIATRNSS